MTIVFQGRVTEIGAAAQQMKSGSFFRGAVDTATTKHKKVWQVSQELYMRYLVLCAETNLGGVSSAKTGNQHND